MQVPHGNYDIQNDDEDVEIRSLQIVLQNLVLTEKICILGDAAVTRTLCQAQLLTSFVCCLLLPHYALRTFLIDDVHLGK